MGSTRPVGNAGRGRHTGKVGWLGGKHRDNSGCFGVIAIIATAAASIAVSISYGLVTIL